MKLDDARFKLAFGATLSVLGGLAIYASSSFRGQESTSFWMLIAGVGALLLGAIVAGSSLSKVGIQRTDTAKASDADLQLAVRLAKKPAPSQANEAFAWPTMDDNLLPKLPLGDDIFLRGPANDRDLEEHRHDWGADVERLERIESADITRATPCKHKRLTRAGNRLLW